MKEISKENISNPGKKSFFELLTEIIGWIQIFASLFLTGLALGLIIYFLLPNTAGFIMAILLGITGLVAGILWANNVWKKKGTIHFMSGITATTDLDNSNDEKKDIF